MVEDGKIIDMEHYVKLSRTGRMNLLCTTSEYLGTWLRKEARLRRMSCNSIINLLIWEYHDMIEQKRRIMRGEEPTEKILSAWDKHVEEQRKAREQTFPLPKVDTTDVIKQDKYTDNITPKTLEEVRRVSFPEDNNLLMEENRKKLELLYNRGVIKKEKKDDMA